MVCGILSIDLRFYGLRVLFVIRACSPAAYIIVVCFLSFSHSSLGHFTYKYFFYMKPGMGFTEGLTFSDNDQGCWELLPTVRTGQIDVHCECMVEKGIDKMNVLEESLGKSANMTCENSVFMK